MSYQWKEILRLRKPPPEVLFTPMLHYRPVRNSRMLISEDEFNREIHYHLVTHFVRIMLWDRLISENEFFRIEVRNRERYKPLIGILLSGKFLLRSSERIDVFICENGWKHHRGVLHYKIDE